MKRKRFNFRGIILLPLLILFAGLLLTGCLESRVGFQGQLTDTSGDPVADGEYEMVIQFFTDETGGTSVYSDTQQVMVQGGLFQTDIADFPPHIFSGEVSDASDTLFMEVSVEGETLTPRRKVAGAPFAHGLVAGSGVIGDRPNAANVADGGYDAALKVVNSQPPYDNPGYGLSVQAGNAGLYSDNVAGAGDASFSPSDNPEENPDIILGGEYLTNVDGDTAVDVDDGPGVIASDLRYPFSDIFLRSNDELHFFKNYGPSIATSDFRILDGPDDIQARLDASGNFSIDGSYDSGGADFAELIAVDGAESSYEPGDVLVISTEQDRAVALATTPNASGIAGVYSAQPGFIGGKPGPDEQVARETALRQENGRDSEAVVNYQTSDGAIEVAITGIVPVKVSAENGAIQRGDLLTTSATPGHAMKATDPQIGTILGKAMGTLESGTGVIEVLVILQ